jgi:hypothetical protein
MLAKFSVPNISELCDDCKGGRSNKKDAGNKHKPEPIPSTTEAHAAYKTVKLLFLHSALACFTNTVFSP